MNLYARQRGEGKPLLFIHGFPMDQSVWDSFGDNFVTSNRVITVDLPGFGKSPILPFPFSLDQVADYLIQFLLNEVTSQTAVIGHSLGGYVALAMANKRPDLFSALGLFHSTAFADYPEKKESRNKVIEFVEKHGVRAFVANFVSPLFARSDHKDIATVKQLSSQSSMDAVIGYTAAMRDRPEHVKTLKSFEKPTLFIGGEKDPGIPVQTLMDQAAISQHPEIHILPNVSHMGMYEKPTEAASKIMGFLGKI